MRAAHVKYIKPKTLKEIRKVGTVIRNKFSGYNYTIKSLHRNYVMINSYNDGALYPIYNRDLLEYSIIDPTCKYGIAIEILKGRA